MGDVWKRGPAHVDFNLTNGCNLACSHCHSSSGDKLPSELETREVLRAVTQLHEMGVLTIAFAGGEPFIRKDIVEILAHACSLPGWRVSVITNGMFFRRDMVDELLERCPELVVNISLDGSTPAGFHTLRRQVRRPDADPGPLFGQVVAGIERVVDAGMETSVNFTLTRPTLDDAEPTYEYVTGELGARGMVAIKFFPGGYGKLHRETFDIPYSLWSATFTELTQQKLAGKLPLMQISVPAPWEFYLPLIEAGLDIGEAERAWGYASPLHEPAYAAHFSLGEAGGLADLAVAADGRVYPSVLYVGTDEASCGNIRTTPLADVWRRSQLLDRLRSLSPAGVEGACSACALRDTCGGGSRARAFATSGRIDAADEACPIVLRSRPPAERPAVAVPRPRPSGAPVAPSDPGPSRMRVLGSGSGAMRIYPNDGGCEVRANGRIAECTGRVAEMLLAVSEPDETRTAEQLAALTSEGHILTEHAASVAELLDILAAPADVRRRWDDWAARISGGSAHAGV